MSSTGGVATIGGNAATTGGTASNTAAGGSTSSNGGTSSTTTSIANGGSALAVGGATVTTAPADAGGCSCSVPGGSKRGSAFLVALGIAVLARWRQARRQLGDWLHVGQRRQPHITLFVCGFPASQPRHDDDFAITALRAQLAALHSLQMPAFSLQIGGLHSFSCAPCLQVSDPQQQLELLRQSLAAHSREIRFAAYQPHLTLGLYRRARPFSQLPANLQQLPPLTLPVRELHYCSYAARDQLGALRVEERVVLS